MIRIADVAALGERLDGELAVSDWLDVTQARIDRFAEATEDRQWIHVDAARAEQSPFKGTIAHGFLTLSLVSALGQKAMRIEGLRMAINYGLNRVRFISPVPAGSRIRGRFVPIAVRAEGDSVQVTWRVTIEREHMDKPCCVVEWIVRVLSPISTPLMKVAFGLKAHSGWAALVGVGERDGDVTMTDRRRIDLVDEVWQKQPYHAAQHLQSGAARDTVARGIDAARKGAVRELRAAIARAGEQHHDVKACGVLVGNPMPDWSVDEILAVHFRMHKAEGALFRDTLLHAAAVCGLRPVAVPEKQAGIDRSLLRTIAALGKSAGPPWAKDQKDAALAALIALKNDGVSRP